MESVVNASTISMTENLMVRGIATMTEAITLAIGQHTRTDAMNGRAKTSDDLIKRSDAIEAIEETDWYHQNRNKDMVSGANSAEHQAWYKAEDVYKALENVPSADRPQDDEFKNFDRGDLIALIEAQKERIGELLSDRPQGWIPCSERLPSEFSDDERVLATTDVDGLGIIIMPIYDVKGWYLKGYISAWMPLPKPLKGADDEDN